VKSGARHIPVTEHDAFEHDVRRRVFQVVPTVPVLDYSSITIKGGEDDSRRLHSSILTEVVVLGRHSAQENALAGRDKVEENPTPVRSGCG